jgi:two-component system, NtrC family, response regulator PilR
LSVAEIATPSVLIVDDEPDLCELMAMEFAELGFQVFVAKGVREAFEIAVDRHVDAIVSDYTMSDGNGGDLLLSLRLELPRAVLVLVTGSIQAEEIVGLNATFHKPCSYRDICATVAQLLVAARG